MAEKEKTREELLAENEELKLRLTESEETLNAIQSGEVDALVVSGPQGDQIYALEGADQAYRTLIEEMNQGAAILMHDGTIFYCNSRLADMVKAPLEEMMGNSLNIFVSSKDRWTYEALLKRGLERNNSSGEILLKAGDGTHLPVYISIKKLMIKDLDGISLNVTDLSEQKRNEAIIASERLSRSIFEQAGESIIVCDENGIITRASDISHKLCNCNPILEYFNNVFHFYDEKMGIFSVYSVLKGKSVRQIEVFLEQDDGSRFYFLISARSIYNYKKEIIGCVIILTDINELKKAEKEKQKLLEDTQQFSEELEVSNEELLSTTEELHAANEELIQQRDELVQVNEALQESERRFRTLAENAPDVIMQFDMDFRILYLNPEVEHATGTPPEEFIGKTNEEMGMPENLCKMWNSAFKKVLKTNKPQQVEFDLLQPTGTKSYDLRIVPELADDGSVKSFIGISRDITERKQFEEALRKTQSSLAEAQRIANVGSWEWNLQTGEINWSDELYSIYGVDPNNFTPTIESFADYVHPDDMEYVNEITNQILTKGISVNFDFRIISSDGVTRILNTMAEITDFDENGNPVLIKGINQDITERKKLEEELRESRDNLEQKVEERTVEIEEAYQQLKENELKLKDVINDLERSNKELQSFAYITSHDLQEPLRTMGNYAGLLKHRYGGQLDSDADDFLDFMASGAARLQDMIKGLLEYSRVGTQGGVFKDFSSEEALDNALSHLKSAIEECHVEVLYDSLPVIHADESQISRIFQNLIGNALKFRKKGIQPKIHIKAQKEGNEYIFSVQDNGIGMEPEYSDRIFEVFKRLHTIGEYDGTGIGLAIVKRIVDRHNGRIWVESELGEGSTFYFTIPAEPQKMEGEAKS